MMDRNWNAGFEAGQECVLEELLSDDMVELVAGRLSRRMPGDHARWAGWRYEARNLLKAIVAAKDKE